MSSVTLPDLKQYYASKSEKPPSDTNLKAIVEACTREKIDWLDAMLTERYGTSFTSFVKNKKRLLGFSLLPHQIDHVKRIVRMFKSKNSILDLSLMGRGKTFTTSYTATVLGSIMVVVCPASVEVKWKEMKTKFNAPVWKVISYESLRGVRNKQPKHGLLKRNDKVTESGTNVVSYTVTNCFHRIVKNRNVLFVFDEVQKVKNRTAQSKACITLVSHACGFEKSRVILLSGTPIDKQEQSTNILRMMDLISMSMLVRRDPETDTINWLGFDKLYHSCLSLNRNETIKIQEKYNQNKTSDYQKFAYDLFIKVVLPNQSSKMPNDVKSNKLNISNRFFHCTDSEKAALRTHISRMKFFTEELSHGGNKKINIISNIQKCLFRIEETKIPIIVRNAEKVLRSGKKVCIMINFTNTLHALKDRLLEYNPVTINGKTPKHKRAEFLKGFQEDSDRVMLVIANMDVLSTGVDMDDKFGNRPRYVFASPNYKTMVIQQMTYRFLRSDTKSDTTIDFVYGNCDTEESSILGCLAKKSGVMRDACMDNGNNKVTYPDEYTRVIG